MKIKVIQEDIDNGYPHDAYYCPVNLAIKRITKLYCVTKSNRVHLKRKGTFKERVITLPENVQRKIQRFDNQNKMTPFEFDLNLSQEWIIANILNNTNLL